MRLTGLERSLPVLRVRLRLREVPMITWEQITQRPTIARGDPVQCPHCEQVHTAFGTIDGEGNSSEALLYYKCDKRYICGFLGYDVTGLDALDLATKMDYSTIPAPLMEYLFGDPSHVMAATLYLYVPGMGPFIATSRARVDFVEERDVPSLVDLALLPIAEQVRRALESAREGK